MIAHFIALWLHTSRLPDVEPNVVVPAVIGAMAAETPDFPAELLIAIGWGETRLDSRVHTKYVCGVMQAVITKRSDCEQWSTDPIAGFRAGVAELEEWRHDRRTGGKLTNVLLAQACGQKAFEGTCQKGHWPAWVIGRARCLEDAANERLHVDAHGNCIVVYDRSS